jgi:hypothetical protein
MRTKDNDNDKAKKYFKDPSGILKEKQTAMLEDTDEGNALIERLKQQSVDNKEKNELSVQRKTFENDQVRAISWSRVFRTERDREITKLTLVLFSIISFQGANFGPFNRQTVILNTDGKTYTLLQSPQAMRLKKDGLIKDRQFVRQPTQDELDGALSKEGDGVLGAIQGIFGGGASSE